MKIWSLVGKESVKISNEEVAEIKSRMNNVLKEKFPEYNGEIIVKRCDDDSVLITATNVGKTGKFRYHGRKTYDLNTGDRVFPSGVVSVQLFKSKCYDENECGECHTWEEGFVPELKYDNYNMYFRWKCNKIRYHSRTEECLAVEDSFMYGTELSDLTFEDNIESVKRICNALA